MNHRDPYREWTAAYVMGALEPDELSEFVAHLHDCSGCQSEVASFARLPALLAQAGPPEAVEVPEIVLRRFQAGVDAELAHLRHGRSVWRGVAAVAALALLIVAIGALLPRPMNEPIHELEFYPGSAVIGQVAVAARPWGTAVDIRLEGLPPAAVYTAWAVDRDGNRQPVATWGPTAEGRAVVSGGTALGIEAIVAIVVTADHDLDVVRAVTKNGQA